MKEKKCGRKFRVISCFCLCFMLMMLAFCEIPAQAATKNITLNHTSCTVKKGKKYTLKATIKKKSYKKKKVVWTSSKKSVATVSSKGVVTAKKVGTATITARVKGTSSKVTCKVKVVYPYMITSLNMTVPQATLEIGQTTKVTTTITPSNASYKTLSYTSSNSTVAKVDSSGKITALSAGTAKITAAAKDGSNKKASLTITVNTPAAVTPSEPSENAKTFINYIQGYSNFIKVYGNLCYKDGNSPTKTYAKAMEIISNPANANAVALATVGNELGVITKTKLIPMNCATPANWALTEMGYLSAGNQIYGTVSGFKGSGLTEIKANTAYGDFISTGAAINQNVQTASDLGALCVGDILSISISGSPHTVVYAGRDDSGNCLVYEAGGIAASTYGYVNYGCGPLNYNNNVSNVKSYKITQIFRLK